MDNQLPRLELPKRWEALKEKSQQADADPVAIVEKVDAAAAYVDRLLRNVRSGGTGQFSVVSGKSGSGKTTFVSTLPKFFDNVVVYDFDNSRSLVDLPKFIYRFYCKTRKFSWVMTRKLSETLSRNFVHSCGMVSRMNARMASANCF